METKWFYMRMLFGMMIITGVLWCGTVFAKEDVEGKGGTPGTLAVSAGKEEITGSPAVLPGKEEVSGKEVVKTELPAPEQKLCFLDPQIVDKNFDLLVGRHIAAVVGDKKLAIEKMPVMDDALDEFGKISPLAFETGFTLSSKYVWRGQNLGNRASLQPYAKAGTKFLPLGTLSFTWWGNFMPDGVSEGVTVDTEHDFTFDYNFDFLTLLKKGGIQTDSWACPFNKLLDFNYATGFIYYHFPPTRTSSNEYYNVLTFNWPFHPYLAAYNDFGPGNGLWYEWGFSQPWDLKLFTVNSYVKFGYNKKQWCSSSKLQTMEYGFSLPIPVGKHMKIEPFISHSVRLNKTYYYTQVDDGNGNLVEQGNVLTQNEFFGGFKYSISF